MGKKVLTGIAFLIGIVLIAGILYIANEFLGNPVSKVLATSSVEKYVNEKYPNLNLKVESAKYNFKNNGYSSKAHSSSSVDTHFDVYCDLIGNITRDSYEESINKRFNTLERLDEEYRKVVVPKIEKLGYDFNMILAGVQANGNELLDIPLDMKLDLNKLPSKRLITYVTVYIYSDDFTWDNVARTALAIDKAMENERLNISKYTVGVYPTSFKEGKTYESIGVYDFDSKLLKSKDLPGFMKNYSEKMEKINKDK
ncbi:MAG: hypothetical protein RR645_00830 [Clostridium sp.]